MGFAVALVKRTIPFPGTTLVCKGDQTTGGARFLADCTIYVSPGIVVEVNWMLVALAGVNATGGGGETVRETVALLVAPAMLVITTR